MTNPLKFGPFEVKVNSNDITIESLSFTPGEAGILTQFMGFAGSMGKFPALPKQIGNPPFEIQFKEDGGGVLLRPGEIGHVEFEFADVDTFIDAVNAAVDVCKDERTLRPQPRAVGS